MQWVMVIIVFIWLMNKLSKIPSMRSLFTAEKVVIDQTPILIKNIKTIAQLVTVTSYDEVVVDSLVYNKAAAIFDLFRRVSPMAMLPSPIMKREGNCRWFLTMAPSDKYENRTIEVIN